jgi:uroporphyrinogen decarboxylase
VIVFYHSDGDVSGLLEDLIEIGVGVLNPVQRECMDIFEIKMRYGGSLSFWGGIGVQSTLPFASPADVRAEVQRIGSLGREGASSWLPVTSSSPTSRGTTWTRLSPPWPS